MTVTAVPVSPKPSAHPLRLGFLGVQALADGLAISGATLFVVGATTLGDSILAVWGIALLLLSGTLRAGIAVAATKRLRPVGGRFGWRSVAPWARPVYGLYVVYLALFAAGVAVLVVGTASALLVASLVFVSGFASSLFLVPRATRAAGDGATFVDSFTLRRYV
jgi:hypothetical protein